MTRESLEKLKALVVTRQKELEESDDPKGLARQRLADSGLVLANGKANPVFDSSAYQQVKVATADKQLFTVTGVKPITKPLSEDYIVAEISSEHIEVPTFLRRYPKASSKRFRRSGQRLFNPLPSQKASHKKK